MSLRIGIIAPNWVGDAVMALPFINTCRHLYPEAKIIVLSKTWVGAVYETHPAINSILTMDKQFQQGFRLTTQYGKDLQSLELDRIYLLSSSFRSAYIAWLSKTPHRIGFPAQGRSLFLSHAVPVPPGNLHRSQRYLELLRFPEPDQFDESPLVNRSGIHLRAEELAWAGEELEHLGFSRAIGLFPFSVASARNIPFPRIRELLEAATDPVLIFGNTSDRDSGKRLEAINGNGKVKSVCGDYTLREVIALISCCRGAIATDSGLGHIAANLDVPTVSLFGAGDPQRTGPQGAKTAVINKQVYCHPCRKNVCRNRREPLLCLNSISTEEVWRALDRLMD
jgi:heptosyltransferase-2